MCLLPGRRRRLILHSVSGRGTGSFLKEERLGFMGGGHGYLLMRYMRTAAARTVRASLGPYRDLRLTLYAGYLPSTVKFSLYTN